MLTSNLQQFSYRQIEMLCKVFYIADACIQSGCGDRLAVDLDRTAGDVLIPGNGFKKRRFARAVSAEQTVEPRFVNGEGDVF